MIRSAPSQIQLTDILRERCIVNSWLIFKNLTCFVIYEKFSFEWDYSHLSSFTPLGAIRQRRWVYRLHFALSVSSAIFCCFCSQNLE